METLVVLVTFVLSLAVGLVVARTVLEAMLVLMTRLAAPRDEAPTAAADASLDLEAAA